MERVENESVTPEERAAAVTAPLADRATPTDEVRRQIAAAIREAVADVWLEFLEPVTQLCGLCGNTGWIDTRGRAVSPAGVECGVRAPCICPNGRSIKECGEVVGRVVEIRARAI